MTTIRSIVVSCALAAASISLAFTSERATACGLDSGTAKETKAKPNIIVIVTDDQGYADLGVQGVLSDIKTPHLDSLASRGVRCEAGYITSPQCSPSRAGLITGRHQARFGVEEISLCPLPTEELTIAEHLKPAGYTTGFIGKWHLDVNTLCANWILKNVKNPKKRGRGFVVPPRVNAPFTPQAQGFDDFFNGTQSSYHCNFDLKGAPIVPPQVIKDDRFRVNVQSDAAVAFIEENHDSPFYLHLCYYAPHVPLEATEKYLSRFPGEMAERRRYGLAMISAVDDGMGRIQAKLREHSIDENTLIFFVSDNGAPLKGLRDLPIDRPGGAWDGSLNTPLAGEKGMLLEGGIRVPYLVSWPARVPKGTTYSRPVSSLDIAATVIAAAQLPPVDSLDGVNILPHLDGGDTREPHKSLYWRFWGQTAIRTGDWKLVRLSDGKQEFLYNVAEDIGETNDQITEFPEIANALRDDLLKWESEMLPARPRGGLNEQEREWFKEKLNAQQ